MEWHVPLLSARAATTATCSTRRLLSMTAMSYTEL